MYPATIFESPKWNLVPDPKGARTYGIVTNALEVAGSTRSYQVALAVPTELFTFLRDVAKATPEDKAALSLDFCGQWRLFSVYVYGPRGDKLFDLWAYTESQLPAWILDRQYRL